MADRDWVDFLQWALPRMGMRWAGFRRVRRQVIKRIRARVRALELTGPDAYRGWLQDHPQEWARLDALCRVTISRFYRDRAVFDALRDRVLPELARAAAGSGSPASVDAWSIGCASGEEPYTLSIVWALAVSKVCPGVGLRILASDADAAMLERARRALYGASSVADLPVDWRRTAFDSRGDAYELLPAFRGPVELRELDIRRSLPPDRYDLIFCRNVAFTYFDEALQRETLERLSERLTPGGALIIGSHEKLPSGFPSLEPPDPNLPIYRHTCDGEAR